MEINGVVYNARGETTRDIVVYVYQTNATGIYPEADTSHGALRGWPLTDNAGRYRFTTIRPAASPGRDAPQHIHFHILERGKGTYYIQSLEFDDDPLLTKALREKHLTARGGSGIGNPRKGADETWHVRRDIYPGRNIPGY